MGHWRDPVGSSLLLNVHLPLTSNRRICTKVHYFRQTCLNYKMCILGGGVGVDHTKMLMNSQEDLEEAPPPLQIDVKMRSELERNMRN